MKAWLRARNTVLMDAEKIAEARESVYEAAAKLERTLKILDELLEHEKKRRQEGDPA